MCKLQAEIININLPSFLPSLAPRDNTSNLNGLLSIYNIIDSDKIHKNSNCRNFASPFWLQIRELCASPVLRKGGGADIPWNSLAPI